MNGMHSSCFHPQLQPRCLPAVPLPRTLSCLPACRQDRALTAERAPAWPRALGTKAQAGQRVQHHGHPPRHRCPSVGGQGPTRPHRRDQPSAEPPSSLPGHEKAARPGGGLDGIWCPSHRETLLKALNPFLPAEETQQSARLPEPLQPANARTAGQECFVSSLPGTCFSTGTGTTCGRKTSRYGCGHVGCSAGRGQASRKKGQGPSHKAPFKKPQVEMSLSLRPPSPQERRLGSTPAPRRGVGMPTRTNAPPSQSKPEHQPPEDKAREEERSPIFPVPCSLGPRGGTATARSPTHRTSAGKNRYDFPEKVWTKTSQWLQIPLLGDTGSCCP